MTTINDILPDDLLLDIFLVAKECHSRDHPQIAISQICRRWRSLALSNPLIWDKLQLEFRGPPSSESSQNRRSRAIAQIFFERSSPLLLDVALVDEWTSCETQLYADVLEPCASRLRSLDMTRIRINFPGIKIFFERVCALAHNLRSIKLSQYEIWHEGATLASEAPAPIPMQLERLALAPSMCMECLPLSLGSIAQLELRQFTPTRSCLSFLFRNMPMLSTLAIEADDLNLPWQHHFYSHEPTIDSESSHLIPSSSLEKLALIYTSGIHSNFGCWSGLESLDVQNLKHLELRREGTMVSRKSQRLPIFQAWNDRLVSLETLVLSPADLLASAGGDQKLIRSSQPGGINLVIQTPPTFSTHERILSSFTEIASLTYYLPAVVLVSPYHGPPTDVKERISNVSFPITFIPTTQWQTSFPDRVIHSHPLLITRPQDREPSCEPVDFIRHMVEIARGGPIPVTFVDSPSSLPGLLSSRTHGDIGFVSELHDGWDADMMDDGDGWHGSVEDFEDDLWGEVDPDEYTGDMSDGDFGPGADLYYYDEDLGDYGADVDGSYEDWL